MKKLTVLAVLLLAMTASGIAFAEGITGEYDSQDNGVSTDVSGYSTVIITKGTSDISEENVVYINQADSAFDGTVQFLLKGESPDDGKYKITVGGNPNADTASKVFAIGVGTAAGDVPMDKKAYIAAEGTGFIANNVKLNEFKSILVKTGGKVMQMNICDVLDTIITGEGVVNIGVQLNGLTDENAEMYLRPAELK